MKENTVKVKATQVVSIEGMYIVPSMMNVFNPMVTAERIKKDKLMPKKVFTCSVRL